jgi:hypothetical protein
MATVDEFLLSFASLGWGSGAGKGSEEMGRFVVTLFSVVTQLLLSLSLSLSSPHLKYNSCEIRFSCGLARERGSWEGCV